MKSLKLMLTGALLILLGPLMSLVDIAFSPMIPVCWLVGIPLFIVGLVMPSNGFGAHKQSEELPQRECSCCGEKHDFDYPKCPFCGHDHSQD